MLALSFHSASSLPWDFVDLLQAVFRTMWSGLLTLTTLLASSSLFQQNAVPGVSAQYLLGLGALPKRA
jgi:hypothetical protein